MVRFLDAATIHGIYCSLIPLRSAELAGRTQPLVKQPGLGGSGFVVVGVGCFCCILRRHWLVLLF